MYELPGGNCEPTLDATILHTVAREALEETGLVVTRVVAEFDGFEYTTRRGPARQLNFLVEVEVQEASASRGGGPDEDEDEGRGRGLPTPILSPEEHHAFAWVGVGDSLEGFPMSESMGKVVRDALAVMGGAELEE
ncbi:hypothetical protein C8R46DRAFT_1091474 [Mycena filopes]|nr:hypothetical protein C8R46DRAFT_1091474 [Mycena filopes]